MPDNTTAAALKELAPTGRLRVAIGVSPAPSAFYALKDATTGKLGGVTVDLGAALAQKLGVPVEFIVYRASGEIQAVASNNVWDVTFMPVDDERRKLMDFGSPYHLAQSSYLVPKGSPIASLADANAAGMRIAGIINTATFRASERASPKATHLAFAGAGEAIAAISSGQADAIALGRESLGSVAARLSGSRILEGGYLNSTTAIAVPKGKPAALAYVSAFIEEAKATGLARRAFDDVGLTSAVVAPAGMKP
jgi:polar amino acid transport system substrate-binding protein